MSLDLKNINKRLVGIALTVALPLSGMTAVMADETEDTSSSEETTAATSADQTAETIDLSGKSFENIYGTQLYSFLNHKYTFEGEEIPLAKSNFFFINSYLDLCQYAWYGYYPMNSEGYFDLAAEFGSEQYKTYGDYFVSYAEKTLENTLVMNKLAEDEGLVASFNHTTKIKDALDNIEQQSKAANMSKEDYIKLYYGPDCTEDLLKESLNCFYTADTYTQHYCDNYQYTDEQKMAPQIRYALFLAPGQSATEDEKAQAEKDAKDLLSKADSLDKLKELGAAAVSEGTSKESNDITVNKGKTVSVFEDWAYDAARKEGDMDIIYAPEYGYFVVGYLGKVEVEAEDLQDIAVAELSNKIMDDIDAGKYQFGTKDAYAPAITTVPTLSPTPSPESSESLPSDQTLPTENNDPSSRSGMEWTPTTIIVLILVAVGGVALTGAIIIMVVQFIRKGSSDKPAKKKEKPAKKPHEVKKEPKKEPKKEEAEPAGDNEDPEV